MKHFYLLVLLAAVFSTGTACTAVSAVSATAAGARLLQAATITDRDVQQYTAAYIKQLDQENTIATGNDPYAQRLDRLTRNLTEGGKLNFKVYKTPEVNAFCTADGSVRVYTGLMDIMTDEELLGVIGHEIGHYMNHDTRDAFRNAMLTSAIREGIASTNTVAGALSASQLGSIAQSLSQSQYSQKQEKDADTYGYNFLKSHNVNPWAMAMAFEKLLELENRSSSQRPAGISQLFSTHPDLAARAKTIAERATRDGYSRPVNK